MTETQTVETTDVIVYIVMSATSPSDQWIEGVYRTRAAAVSAIEAKGAMQILNPDHTFWRNGSIDYFIDEAVLHD